jgi:hypothetical protein
MFGMMSSLGNLLCHVRGKFDSDFTMNGRFDVGTEE